MWLSAWGSEVLVTAPQPHWAFPKVASPRVPTLPCCFLAYNGRHPAEQAGSHTQTRLSGSGRGEEWEAPSSNGQEGQSRLVAFLF